MCVSSYCAIEWLAVQLTSDPGPEEIYSRLLHLVVPSSHQLRTGLSRGRVAVEKLAVNYLHSLGISVSRNNSMGLVSEAGKRAWGGRGGGGDVKTFTVQP